VLVPKLVTTLKTYNREQFIAYLTAGVIVGIVALPLAIAFAIASGLTPDRGLYTAVIAGFIISALGGSRVQIGGPTGAFVVIVYGIVQQYGVDGLMVATLMAGLLLIGLGLARVGGAPSSSSPFRSSPASLAPLRRSSWSSSCEMCWGFACNPRHQR